MFDKFKVTRIQALTQVVSEENIEKHSELSEMEKKKDLRLTE